MNRLSRLFSRNLLLGDNFLEISTDAKALYISASMLADNYGFVSMIQAARTYGIEKAFIEELEENGYIHNFEDVSIIMDWFVNNENSDRMMERSMLTEYEHHLKKLNISENGRYEFIKGDEESLLTTVKNKKEELSKKRKELKQQQQDKQQTQSQEPLSYEDKKNNAINKHLKFYSITREKFDEIVRIAKTEGNKFWADKLNTVDQIERNFETVYTQYEAGNLGKDLKQKQGQKEEKSEEVKVSRTW